MKANSKRRDYHSHSWHDYRWRKGELLQTVLVCAAAAAIPAYFFYRSIWAMLPLSAAGVFLFRNIQRKKAERARRELSSQFRECILCVSTSLRAGYSVENAFLETEKDMRVMYGKDSLICGELEFLRRGLNINISVEELLEDIAKRSGCEDIGEFARVFALAKRNGGNMAEIIQISANRIGKKIELRGEIQTVLSGRQMEFMIMRLMPFGILFYIEMGTPDYFAPLYHNPLGVAVMTGCLAVYLGAYFLGEAVLGKLEAEFL